ncbi:MAG: lipopolysaccharide biosynthesis protein [Promethearchaeota archaeon]
MSEPTKNNVDEELKQNQRTLAKSSIFSLLYKYGVQIFSIFTSILMARIVSQAEWGLLILAISYTGIFSQIISYLPPGLDSTLNYYIPRYIGLNKYNSLKSLIKNMFFIRVVILIPACVILLLFIFFLSNIFFINLNESIYLLYIMFPIVIVSGINQILAGINRGFNMFKLMFQLLVLSNAIYLGGLIVFFLFLRNIGIEPIAILYTISIIIPFLINLLLMIIKLIKLKKKSNDLNSSFRADLKKIISYGTPVTLTVSMYYLWEQIQIQAIGTFQPTEVVTGFSIAKNYSQNSINAVTGFNEPLITSVSKLHSQKNFNEINKIYNTINKFSVFILFILTGTLYFLADFFLKFIYGESYLIFSIYLRILLFAFMFRIFLNMFETYVLATNKVKLLPIYKSIAIIILAILFFFGLMYYGILGALVGLLLGNIALFVMYLFLTLKFLSIKLKSIFLQYCTFFISFAITLFLQLLFFQNFEDQIFISLNLGLFQNLHLLAIIIFLGIYLCLNIIFRIFTKKDIEDVESFFRKDTMSHRFIKKVLNITKKVVR